MYTSCAWMHDTGSLAFGTTSGAVKIVNYLGQVNDRTNNKMLLNNHSEKIQLRYDEISLF